MRWSDQKWPDEGILPLCCWNLKILHFFSGNIPVIYQIEGNIHENALQTLNVYVLDVLKLYGSVNKRFCLRKIYIIIDTNFNKNINITAFQYAGARAHTHTPVSYTHLDVYKRQKHDTIFKALNIENTQNTKTCLLYTSRCV